MKIAFVINNILTEWPGYTTTCLAYEATKMSHEVWYISVGDFVYDTDESVHANACSTALADMTSLASFINSIRNSETSKKYINVEELDALMLRNDPAEDAQARPWGRLAGINFSRFAALKNVLVLNDPDGLSKAINKLYLQLFPREIRPETLITMDKNQVKAFAEKQGVIVIKPLVGSGGRNVFLLRPEDQPNMNQMLESVSRDGYIIAQEYLPDAVNGDVRVFLMNGELLQVDGKIAAFRRVRKGGDMRSNMSAGATSAPHEVTPASLYNLANKISPIVKQDGLFLTGIDVVGDKIMEINVFSPGGIDSANKFNNVNFATAIIDNINNKVEHRANYPELSNLELATLA